LIATAGDADAVKRAERVGSVNRVLPRARYQARNEAVTTLSTRVSRPPAATPMTGVLPSGVSEGYTRRAMVPRPSRLHL
jgi:hypothetical protein